MLNKTIKELFLIILVVILSFGACRPLLIPGFFSMHDDTQPARVYEMTKALSSGQFPVRWVDDLGYGSGYPLFNFYAPLPYYVGGLFNLAGFDVIASTKIMFLMGILLASLSMYFFVKELIGDIPAIVSAVLYTYAPYHAVNLYIRGAVGEFYAYGFLPLLFLGLYMILKKKYCRSGIILGSVGLAGILLSHNIFGLITGFFLGLGLLIYFIFLIIKRQKIFTIYYLLFTILLGFGLSSFFILPAVTEAKYTKVSELTTGGSDFHNHFVYIDQLWNSPWGYAGSAAGRDDGMSFKIGKTHLILGLMGILTAFYLYKKKRIPTYQLSIINYQLLLLAISVFLMLDQSKFIWEIIPGFSFIQYPWRFLNFTIFSLSLMAVLIFIPLKKTVRIITAVGVTVLILWLNLKYFSPKEYRQIFPEDYINSANLRFKISKISDEYLPKEYIIPKTVQELAGDKGLVETSFMKIKEVAQTPTEKQYKIEIENPLRVTTNITFFPGWQAYLDGQKITLFPDKGKNALELPLGTHTLIFRFVNTPVRILGNSISILSIILIVYVSLFCKKKHYAEKN